MKKIQMWTIQTYEMFSHLIDYGYVCGDMRFIDEDYREPYMWMTSKMRCYNIRNAANCQCDELSPIWCWYKWSKDNHRPDLRASWHLPKGVKGVRIEILVDFDRVLLSDFDLWHFPLNRWYLSCSVIENGEGTISKISMEESWDNIFVQTNDDILNNIEMIQGTMWSIVADDIVHYDEFVAR